VSGQEACAGVDLFRSGREGPDFEASQFGEVDIENSPTMQSLQRKRGSHRAIEIIFIFQGLEGTTSSMRSRPVSSVTDPYKPQCKGLRAWK
jgi:hypothetical protein